MNIYTYMYMKIKGMYVTIYRKQKCSIMVATIVTIISPQCNHFYHALIKQSFIYSVSPMSPVIEKLNSYKNLFSWRREILMKWKDSNVWLVVNRSFVLFCFVSVQPSTEELRNSQMMVLLMLILMLKISWFGNLHPIHSSPYSLNASHYKKWFIFK